MKFSSPSWARKKEEGLFELALSTVRIDPCAATINPYRGISLPLYGKDRERMEKLLQLLTHCNTILNKTYRMKNKQGQYESTREDYVNALLLIEDLVELYKDKRTRYEHELLTIIRSYCPPDGDFTRKDLENLLGYRRTQAHNILKHLENRALIKRSGGNKRYGYKYRLT